MAHHDEYNAAVTKHLAHLAAPPSGPRIGQDAALLVIDVQEDFCPPVRLSIVLFYLNTS
jgi:hypothetical protein